MSKKISLLFLLSCFFIFLSHRSSAQCHLWTGLQQVQSTTATNWIFGNDVSPERDKLGRPFVYIAAAWGGLWVYDINLPANPVRVATVAPSVYGGDYAIRPYQVGNRLYLVTGNIWANSSEPPGLAIFDISNPASPVFLDHYSQQGGLQGAGVVVVRDDYAYLGSNVNGLTILDISDSSNIQFKSRIDFLNNFPHTQQGNDSMYNARGLQIQGDYAYVCYDRGGLRVVNISDVNNPVQVNQYCFPDLINKATAYNNIEIHDTLAFVALDYAGLEILSIADPMNIYQVAWWKPNDWPAPTNDIGVWGNSPGHANEIEYDSTCSKLYVSAGRSNVVAISVADPSNPVTCEIFPTPILNRGAWGIDLFQNELYVTYLFSAFFPYNFDTLGFASFMTPSCSVLSNEDQIAEIVPQVYPNPFHEDFTINLGQFYANTEISLYNTLGQKLIDKQYPLCEAIELEAPNETGIYFLEVKVEGKVFNFKLVRE